MSFNVKLKIKENIFTIHFPKVINIYMYLKTLEFILSKGIYGHTNLKSYLANFVAKRREEEREEKMGSQIKLDPPHTRPHPHRKKGY